MDEGGHDVLEGVGLNRSATQTQKVPIVYPGTAINPCIDETNTLTLQIGDNLVPSAQVQVDLYYAMGA